MFSIPSLQKIMLLIAILGAVWYGFKFLGRVKQARDAEAKGQAPKRPTWNPWSGRKAADKSPAVEAEEMVQCPICSTYVAARGAGSCGKPGCPY